MKETQHNKMVDKIRYSRYKVPVSCPIKEAILMRCFLATLGHLCDDDIKNRSPLLDYSVHVDYRYGLGTRVGWANGRSGFTCCHGYNVSGSALSRGNTSVGLGMREGLERT